MTKAIGNATERGTWQPPVGRCVARIGFVLVACWAGLCGCDNQGQGVSLFQPRVQDQETWSIRCIGLTGPRRFQLAEQYAEALRKVQGLRGELVQVVNAEEESIVYYGRYQRQPGEGDKPATYRPDQTDDLVRIRSLQSPDGQVRPFLLATLEPLATYETSNPEWDLNNADGYWSLQVAVFYNTGEFHARRTAAEQYCSELRKQGVEAYFHHGSANSVVCVGLFPREAVQEVQREDPLLGVVRPTIEYVDERLKKLQEEFPRNLQNGHELYSIEHDPRTGERQKIPQPSFLVRTPAGERIRQQEQGGEL